MSGVSCLLWCTGANKATKPIEKEAVALLLPAAITYLQQLSKPAVHAAHAAHAAMTQQNAAETASMTAAMSAAGQASGSDDNKAGKGPPDAVRAFFAAQVRQFMTAKLKAPQGKDLEAKLCMSILSPRDRFLCGSCFLQEGLGARCS